MASTTSIEPNAYISIIYDGFLRGASHVHLQRHEALPMSMAIKALMVLPKIPFNYLYTLFLTLDGTFHGTFRLRLRDHGAGDEADELPPLVDGHDDLSGC
ncbi:hypothetical protein C8J57DRAFT_1538438 [Mycena rebaudengoi]|nr:hypothetical protein C8J57DRAFT_1538438 [Mycena rebaudengoi]